MTWDEFSVWLTQPENGDCKMAVAIDDLRYAALAPRMFGVSIIIGDIGDRYGFNEEYSYSSGREALPAYVAWIARGFHGQPDGWVRHTSTTAPTERRPARPAAND